MAYMRGTYYIFGSADGMEFHVGAVSRDGHVLTEHHADALPGTMPGAVRLPYEICDQFVVMRYRELSWRERRRLARVARAGHGRPEHPFWRTVYRLRLPLVWRLRRLGDE